MKSAERVSLPLLLAAILAAFCACTPVGRGDAHLTICIEERLGCSVQTEISAPPFSDWLLALVPKRSPSGSETTEQHQALRAIERDGRQYAALTVRFDHVRELQALVASEQPTQRVLPSLSEWAEAEDVGAMLQGLLAQTIPDMPVPLTHLAVEVDDESPLWTVYVFEAEISAERSTLIGSVTDLTYHVELPGLVTRHDAHHREGRTLSWSLVPGETLDMHARSLLSKLPGGNSTLWIGGGVTVLAFAAGLGLVLYWTVWRVRRPALTGPSVYEDTLYSCEASFGDDEDLLPEYGWESGTDDAHQGQDDPSDSDASDLWEDGW